MSDVDKADLTPSRDSVLEERAARYASLTKALQLPGANILKIDPVLGSHLQRLQELRIPKVFGVPALGAPKLGGALGAYMAGLHNWLPAFKLIEQSPAFNEISEKLGRIAETFQSVWQKYAPQFNQFSERLAELPERTQEALLEMGGHGWYLDGQMAFDMPEQFKHRVDIGESDAAEADMASHFERRSTGIQEELIKAFPQRTKVLNAAFDAHRNGQYELSIPVFLAQVDGICVERGGGHMFMKDKKKDRPEIYEYARSIASGALAMAYISPLEQVMPIGLSASKRPHDFSALNRHMVLHGESVDYGTKANSLRAISLLNYVFQVICQDLVRDEEVFEGG